MSYAFDPSAAFEFARGQRKFFFDFTDRDAVRSRGCAPTGDDGANRGTLRGVETVLLNFRIEWAAVFCGALQHRRQQRRAAARLVGKCVI